MEPNTPILKKHFTADLRPAYYDSFQCLAEKCKVTCCTGWTIQFDRKDYLTIRQQKGSDLLNTAIKDALRRIKSTDPNIYAAFHLKEDGCPLLTEDKLCRLQAECSYDALPKVCKEFPRLKLHSPSGYLEHSLSLACEAVLELLWNLPEGIDFVSDPLPKKELVTKAISVEDLTLASHFQDIRALCIGLLQDRRFPLRERILLMGIFLQKLTAEDADIPAWLQQTEAMLQLPEIAEISASLFASVTEEQKKLILMQHVTAMLKMPDGQNHKTLQGFQQMVLKELIADRQPSDDGKRTHTTLHIQKFADCRERFAETFADREYFFENLAVSVFFYQALPHCDSTQTLWRSYVNFCNLYSLFRCMAICSCLNPAAEEAKDTLFAGILCISRQILHNNGRQKIATEEFFENQNASLAHMAILLSL